MKALLAVAAGFVFLVAAGAQDNEAIKKDRELFKGKWQFAEFETAEGKQDNFQGASLSFDADKVEFKKGDETKKGTYTLNPAGKPKEIDLKGDGKEILGIYKFDKETLTMCICDQPNQARPSEFAAKNPYVLITLKRIKD